MILDGKVVLDQRIDLHKLPAVCLDGAMSFAKGVRERIDYIWEHATREEALFNGPFYRLLDFDISQAIKVGRTDFKTIYGLNKLNKLMGYDLSQISVGASVQTLDGHFVVGIRENDFVDLIGGGFQPEEDFICGDQLQEHMLVELAEETGVASDIDKIECIGLLKDMQRSNAIFHFKIALGLSDSEVMSRFIAHAMPEFKELKFLDRLAYQSFLNNRGGYRRVIPELQSFNS